MKIGISFNIFDNFQLLPAAIRQIRPHVQHISVVYQNISNYKQQADPNLLPFLQDLLEKGIINQIFEFVPTAFGNSACHRNEHLKRQKGQELSWFAGMTHHMSMDSDEFYESDKFKEAINIIKANDYDVTFVPIQDYHYNPTYKVKGLADYFVPFINKITTRLVIGNNPVVRTDPTRVSLDFLKPYVFNSQDLTMHHATKCRIDRNAVLIKYSNSSARQNFKNIEQMVDEVINFVPDENVEIVEDMFGISQTFEEYKKKYLT